MGTVSKSQQLLDAAANGESGRVRKLALVEGVDINTSDEHGNTAFSLATMNGHKETATTILAIKKALYHKKLEEGRGRSFARDIKRRKRHVS